MIIFYNTVYCAVAVYYNHSNEKTTVQKISYFVRCKTQNHPQTSHKLAKVPTNQPQTSQTTHKPAKYCTNHSLISHKLHASFLGRNFLWLGINSAPKNRNICCPAKYNLLSIPRKKKNRCVFLYSCQILHFVFSIEQFFIIPKYGLQS